MTHFHWQDGQVLAWAFVRPRGWPNSLWLMGVLRPRRGGAAAAPAAADPRRVKADAADHGTGGGLAPGSSQLNLVISTALASLLPGGSVSYLYYADRLNQLPLGVVGIAVATAILPPLSRQVRHWRSRRAPAATQNRGRRAGASC